jgi:hypothetical protein
LLLSVARELLQLYICKSTPEAPHGVGGVCASISLFLDFLYFEFRRSDCRLPTLGFSIAAPVE